MTMHESFLVFIALSYLVYITLGAVIGFVFGFDFGSSQIRKQAIARGYAEHSSTGEWQWKKSKFTSVREPKSCLP